MTNFFKTRYKGEKRGNDKFLGGYVPQELFDVLLLISAFSGKTKTCIILEALTDYVKNKFPNREKLEDDVSQRALRTWNIVKASESKNTSEDFTKNVKYELKSLGLSEIGIGRVIKILEEHGKN